MSVPRPPGAALRRCRRAAVRAWRLVACHGGAGLDATPLTARSSGGTRAPVWTDGGCGGRGDQRVDAWCMRGGVRALLAVAAITTMAVGAALATATALLQFFSLSENYRHRLRSMERCRLMLFGQARGRLPTSVGCGEGAAATRAHATAVLAWRGGRVCAARQPCLRGAAAVSAVAVGGGRRCSEVARRGRRPPRSSWLQGVDNGGGRTCHADVRRQPPRLLLWAAAAADRMVARLGRWPPGRQNYEVGTAAAAARAVLACDGSRRFCWCWGRPSPSAWWHVWGRGRRGRHGCKVGTAAAAARAVLACDGSRRFCWCWRRPPPSAWWRVWGRGRHGRHGCKVGRAAAAACAVLACDGSRRFCWCWWRPPPSAWWHVWGGGRRGRQNDKVGKAAAAACAVLVCDGSRRICWCWRRWPWSSWWEAWGGGRRGRHVLRWEQRRQPHGQ